MLCYPEALSNLYGCQGYCLVFNIFPKQRIELQNFMKQVDGKMLHLVTQGDTRWYSYFRLILNVINLINSRQALDLLNNSIDDKHPPT